MNVIKYLTYFLFLIVWTNVFGSCNDYRLGPKNDGLICLGYNGKSFCKTKTSRSFFLNKKDRYRVVRWDKAMRCKITQCEIITIIPISEVRSNASNRIASCLEKN